LFIENCRIDKPRGIIIDQINDWWRLLQPGVHSQGYNLSSGHAFQFVLHPDFNVIAMKFKLWATNDTWQYPLNGGTFFTGKYSQYSIGCIPKLVLDIPTLRKSILNQKVRLGECSFEWWTNFLNIKKEANDKRCQECVRLRISYKQSSKTRRIHQK